MDTTYSLKAVCDVMSNLCQYITCGLVHKEDGDDSERSPLLRPSPQRTTTQPTLSNHYWEDEERDLNCNITHNTRPLHRIADNEELNIKLNDHVGRMINIPAIKKPISERDLKKREKVYERRMERIQRPLPLKSSLSVTNSLNGSISGAKEVVVKQMPDEDVKQITYFSQRAAEAVRKGFQIDCNESVIVAFNP